MGFFPGAFAGGVAGEPDYLGAVVHEGPAIEGISGKRSDAFGAEFFWVFNPTPIVCDGLGILAGDVESDLRGAVGEYVFGEGKLVHALCSEDEGYTVFS